MNRRVRINAKWLGLVCVALAGGCQLIEDPFVDPLAGQERATTASVEGIRVAQLEPEVRQRPFAASQLRTADGAVTHSPLYFEDAPDTASADDGTFAWTGADWGRSAMWGRRLLENLVFFPISAVVHPPWTVMVSDGEPSRTWLGVDYDARRQAAGGEAASATEPPPAGEGSSDTAAHDASTHG